MEHNRNVFTKQNSTHVKPNTMNTEQNNGNYTLPNTKHQNYNNHESLPSYHGSVSNLNFPSFKAETSFTQNPQRDPEESKSSHNKTVDLDNVKLQDISEKSKNQVEHYSSSRQQVPYKKETVHKIDKVFVDHNFTGHENKAFTSSSEYMNAKNGYNQDTYYNNDPKFQHSQNVNVHHLQQKQENKQQPEKQYLQQPNDQYPHHKELYPQKKQLNAQQRDQFPKQLNEQNPQQHKKQYPQQHKEQYPQKHKQYPQQHKEQYPQQHKEQYPQQHKEQFPQQHKQYPQQHKEQYPQQHKGQYPQQHKQYAHQHKEQYPQQHKEHYTQQHKEQYPQQYKKCPEQHKEQYPQQHKEQYPQQHKEQLPQQHKQYPEQHKEQYQQQHKEQYPLQHNEQYHTQTNEQHPKNNKKQLPSQQKQQIPQQNKNQFIQQQNIHEQKVQYLPKSESHSQMQSQHIDLKDQRDNTQQIGSQTKRMAPAAPQSNLENKSNFTPVPVAPKRDRKDNTESNSSYYNQHRTNYHGSVQLNSQEQLNFLKTEKSVKETQNNSNDNTLNTGTDKRRYEKKNTSQWQNVPRTNNAPSMKRRERIYSEQETGVSRPIPKSYRSTNTLGGSVPPFRTTSLCALNTIETASPVPLTGSQRANSVPNLNYPSENQTTDSNKNLSRASSLLDLVIAEKQMQNSNLRRTTSLASLAASNPNLARTYSTLALYESRIEKGKLPRDHHQTMTLAIIATLMLPPLGGVCLYYTMKNKGMWTSDIGVAMKTNNRLFWYSIATIFLGVIVWCIIIPLVLLHKI